MDIYKKKPLNFCEGIDRRQLRLHRKSLHQKQARNNGVNQRRGIILDSDNVALSPHKCEPTATKSIISRREQLAKWKEEKLLRKVLKVESKKPAFKFCKIKYDIPVFLHSNGDATKPQKTGVITRSMAKTTAVGSSTINSTRLATKIPKKVLDTKDNKSGPKQMIGKTYETRNAKLAPGKNKLPVGAKTSAKLIEDESSGKTAQNEKTTRKLPIDKQSNDVTSKLPVVNKRRSPRLNVEMPSTTNEFEPDEIPHPVSRKSFAPENFQFKAPDNLPVYEFNPTVLPSDSIDKSEIKNDQPEAQEVRIEHAVVEEITQPPEPESEINQNNNADVNSDTKSVDYFRHMVKDTTRLLMENSDKWNELNNGHGEEISDNVKGQILTVIGQTNLLVTKKFKQFSGLIDECEKKEGQYQTNTDDLQGFWDMMYFQVEDLLAKYKKLDKIMSDNWVEMASPVKKLTVKMSKATTKVRVNKTLEARQRLAKAKAAKLVNEVFSPLPANSLPENECVSHLELPTEGNGENINIDVVQPLVRVTERMSFLRQISTRENIGVVDKSNLANLFSPIKAEVENRISNRNTVNDSLIRFSDIHSLGNKENVRKTSVSDIFSPVKVDANTPINKRVFGSQLNGFSETNIVSNKQNIVE